MTDFEVNDLELQKFIEVVLRQYSYDFRSYAKASLKRRVKAAIIQMGLQDITDLSLRTEQDSHFFGSILQYLTVSTTEMFRDPQFFLSFRQDVVPHLKTYPSCRLWIAGSSTGEEFYSYAIILKEEGLLDRTTIYATDINPESLKKAERGVYPIDRAQLYSENYLKAGGKASLADYYHADYEGIIFNQQLKRNSVFTDHCLVTDNVFTEAQFISCRNVLIYFEKKQQDRALDLFLQTLCSRGFLGLGSKETLRFSNVAPEFEAFSEPSIYRRKR